MRGRSDLVFISVAAIVVGAAILIGIRAIGTPAENRVRQLDARRLSDLQDIQRAIDLRWTGQHSLPESLDALSTQTDPPPSIHDPVSRQPYAYRRQGERRYELCAEFSESSTPTDVRPDRGFWSHPAGRHCYVLEPRDLTP